MTKLQNFFQNPFNATFEGLKDAAKAETNSRTAKAANEVFADKPYSTENKGTYTISKIIGYVANFVSFATGFFALRTVLALTVGTLVATMGALFLCALIEILKNGVWKTNVKAILKYKKPSPIGLVVLGLLSLLSIGASGYGAYLLPTEISSPPPASFSKNDSISINELAAINGQISNLDALMLQTSAKAIPNEKGQISSTIKSLMKSQTAQKDSLTAQKRAITAQIAAITAKQAENEKQSLIDHKNGLLTAQISCLVVALLFELIYIWCACYGFYYLFRVYVDFGDLSNPQPTPTHPQTPPQQTVPNQHTPTNQTPPQIGFKIYPPNNQTNQQLTNPQSPQTNSFTTVLKPFENGLVGVENGIKFVWHNGKKYTKTDVQNNVWAFRSKVKQQSSPAKIERYKQHLERWESYLNAVL